MKTSGVAAPSAQGDPALRFAFKLLSYRGRSEKEMAERLRRKGFDASAVERVIDHLRSAGFLDDRKLASSLKRYAAESKHLSILGTKRLLAERGVPRDLIEGAIEDIDETEIARRLVEKKIAAWRKHLPPGESRRLSPEVIRKLYGFLSRRGYPSEMIRKTLEQLQDPVEDRRPAQGGFNAGSVND